MNSSRSDEHQPIPFAGSFLGRYRHVCAFFDSVEEEHRILAPFIRDGLERGEKSYNIVDPEQRANYVRRLEDDGIAVAAAEARGQFELRTWNETYLRTGSFDQDAMLNLLDDELKATTTQGFPLLRLVAHVQWPVEGRMGVDDMVVYETRFNYVVVKYPHPVICIHDASKFSGGVVMDILRTHPMVLVGGLLHENPFFVPPDEFLSELHERTAKALDA
jgi:hypothetical protein